MPELVIDTREREGGHDSALGEPTALASVCTVYGPQGTFSCRNTNSNNYGWGEATKMSEGALLGEGWSSLKIKQPHISKPYKNPGLVLHL